MTPPRKRVLIVDPSDSRQLASHLARDTSIAVESSLTTVVGTDPFAAATQGEPDLIVVDASMQTDSALSLLREIKSQSRSAKVLVVTPTGSVPVAVQAMKSGATEVIEKPTSHVDFLSLMHSLIAGGESEGPVLMGDKTSRFSVSGDFGPMTGASQAMRSLYATIEQLARRDTTVLVTGESGTGKELVAREIHARSMRADKPFVAINCAAIPESLIESELFGHEKGAFTHAVERKMGQIELANGGTLFLDEIGELSLAVQVKLLRFLQEQEFYRVGRSKPIHVDVRVVTATNRDLDECVREKTFRQDLLYRINVISMHLPALRDRCDDIPRLVEHCIRKLSPRYGGRELSFAPESIAALCAYPWPGNVRELENVVEGLLALNQTDHVVQTDLPLKVRERRVLSENSSSATQYQGSGMAFGEAEKLFETEMIVRALEKSGYVQTRAAELLGITRRILKYKMDKLGISDKGQVFTAGGTKSSGEGH